MYKLKYGHKEYEFADEATAHQFLQSELGFRDKADYDKLFVAYAKVYSNSELPQKVYQYVAAMPQELRDLMDELRKHEWRMANEEARQEWQQKLEQKKLEQTADFRASQEKELEAIRQDEQGRWLVAHPGSTPAQFAQIWPIRLAQLESEWRTQYTQDRLAQLRASGGY
jgi:hypothetical protein